MTSLAPLSRGHHRLAQLRGFGLDFAESEKLFPCESVPALWITPENPL
jgi:hypothetical protein